jgi:hypothetical protein
MDQGCKNVNEKWFKVWRHSHQFFTTRKKVVVVFFSKDGYGHKEGLWKQ